MDKQYYVYIMTNSRDTVLYTGVTSWFKKKGLWAQEKVVDRFTKKYNVTKLVYYEVFQNAENAIIREKQIEAGSRQKKMT